METGFLINLGLALHLAGLSTVVGVVLTKYLSFKSLFSDGTIDHRKWTIVLASTKKLNIYIGIGMGVAILSGVLMMYVAYRAFMYQIWFQTKIAVLVVIIIAGIIAMGTESKLRKLLSERMGDIDDMLVKLTRKIKLATAIQLFLFIIIIVLASFRFT
jgi:hypothetical protein